MSDEIHYEMLGSLRSYWWITVLRGVISILFGIAILARPGVTANVLLLIFGALALTSGVLAVISAISLAAHQRNWWAMFVEGLAGILVGLLTLFMPIAAMMTLALLIAVWAIFTGVFQIAASFSRFDTGGRPWLIGIGGILSLIFGIALMSSPAIGIVTLIWLFGIYLIVFGVDLIIMGLHFKHLVRQIDSRRQAFGT